MKQAEEDNVDFPSETGDAAAPMAKKEDAENQPWHENKDLSKPMAKHDIQSKAGQTDGKKDSYKDVAAQTKKDETASNSYGFGPGISPDAKGGAGKKAEKK